MPTYSFNYVLQQGNDNIIPEELVMILGPSSIHHYFIRMTIFFSHIDSLHDLPRRSRHTLELSVPIEEELGEDWLPWKDIIDFLNQIGSPVPAFRDIVLPLTIYAEEMASLESNDRRMVLPLEVNLFFNEVPAMVMVKAEEGGDPCCICLDDMDVGSMTCRLPCQHVYHEGCIREWVRYNRSCPLCRFQFG